MVITNTTSSKTRHFSMVSPASFAKPLVMLIAEWVIMQGSRLSPR